jgi:DNA invertase Pin-like site-specific DNA recombinase
MQNTHQGRPSMKIVAYTRVSTGKQGRSGLGLEAQKAAIEDYARSVVGEIIQTFVEVESGANNERTELAKALTTARKQKATLVVAKLDRLGRDAAFLLNLVQTCRCPIVLADCPNVDKMMFGILAVIAENEREAISKRTKAALAAAKARGVKLGGPTAVETSKIARAAHTKQSRAKAMNILPIITSIENAGIITLRGIADALEARGVKTPTGNANWHPSTVARIKLKAA